MLQLEFRLTTYEIPPVTEEEKKKLKLHHSLDKFAKFHLIKVLGLICSDANYLSQEPKPV